MRYQLRLAAAGILVFAPAAQAQERPAAQPNAAAQPDTVALDAIVVTAQRRSERLQDVPLTVTALSGAALAKAGITGIRDLQTLVSGVTFGGLGTVSALTQI